MQFPFSFPRVTIPAGAFQSNYAFIGDADLVGLIMPAAWTAAPLAFYGSADGVSFSYVVNGQGLAPVKIPTPTPSTFIAISENPPYNKVENFRGLEVLILQSGLFGATVNQTVAATITLVLKKSTTGAY